MDAGTLIVGIILAACCFVPFFYLVFLSNANVKKYLRTFEQQAQLNGLEITERDAVNTKVIGLDKNSRKILFVDHRDGKVSTELVNLSDFDTCRATESHRTVERSGYNVTERLALDFINKNQQSLNRSLEFYHIDKELDLENEQVILRKWQGIVREYLNASRPRSFRPAA